MDKDTKVMLTVREWAEKAGLKLYNYDGFRGIYSRLSGKPSDNFQTNTVTRFRDAGDLVCTRKAFESRLLSCTMQVPQMSQYEKMSEVIPKFVELDINLSISAIMGQLRHSKVKGDEIRTELEKLLSLMKQKVTVREKSIRINDPAEEVQISELDETGLSPSEIAIIKKYNGTVESLEAKLSDEVIQNLEEMLQKGSKNLKKVPLDKIGVLTSLLHSTARQKVGKQIDEEFMLINIPGQKKEPFIKTYNIIGGEGLKTGVAFDIENESGRISGTMRTTPTIDDKIKKTTGGNVIDPVLHVEETSRALQVIDSEVNASERMSLIARIKEFVKNRLNKIKGNNMER